MSGAAARTIRLRMTEAQHSAVVCRDWSEDPAMRKAWDGGPVLVFNPEDAEALADEVCSASNAEDTHAQILRAEKETECARGAAGSATALANLMLRICRTQPSDQR